MEGGGERVTDRRREILEAALAIADERGVDAVTMRAVAARVGVTPMALYPYVGNKSALLDGLVELLVGELPAAATQGGWRERLLAMGAELRTVARRHPTVFGLLLARPSATVGAMHSTDAVFSALLDAGVPPADVPRVERLVSTFVIGYAVSEVAGRFGAGSRDIRGARIQGSLDELPGHRAIAEHLDVPVDWDAEFQRDLDDLAVLIEHAASSRRRRRRTTG
jgi:AcrR family transcriptional regulator